MTLLAETKRRVVFKPHPGQWPVWEASARYKFIIAGTGGGKTYFAPRYVFKRLRERGNGATWLAVSPTYRMGQRILIPEYRKFLIEELGIAQYHKADAYFEIHDGPFTYTINMGSADNPYSMEGQHVDGVHLDECGMMERLAWEVSQRRVGFLEGDILGTSTPYYLNWLKTDVLDRYTSNDPLYFVSQYASTVNPYYPREELERARREMPDWRFRMMYLGQFERPAGLIYADFSEGEHLVDPFDVPEDWPRFAGLDWGFNNPTACLAGVLSPDDVLYLHGEYYEAQKTVSQHADGLKPLLGKLDPDGTWRQTADVYSDPSAKAEAAQLAQFGIHTVPADNEVLAGINDVTARIRTGRLKVLRGRCPHFLDEVASYRWKTQAGTEGFTDQPVKENDHTMDAMRYLVRGARPRLREPQFV